MFKLLLSIGFFSSNSPFKLILYWFVKVELQEIILTLYLKKISVVIISVTFKLQYLLPIFSFVLKIKILSHCPIISLIVTQILFPMMLFILFVLIKCFSFFYQMNEKKNIFFEKKLFFLFFFLFFFWIKYFFLNIFF